MIDRFRRALAALSVLACPAVASAQAELTVDPARSNITIEICIEPDLGRRCDDDASPIQGFASILLDDYGNPGVIRVRDFDLALQRNLRFVFDYGLVIGRVILDMQSVAAYYATPGVPSDPGIIDEDGSFLIVGVPTLMRGTVKYSSTGLLGALIGSGQFDLSEFGAVPSDLGGVLTVTGERIALDSALSFDGEFDLQGVPVTIKSDATLHAEGDAPPPPDCYADCDGNDRLDIRDFFCFQSAFAGGDTYADCDQNGRLDIRDFFCFQSAYAAGCP